MSFYQLYDVLIDIKCRGKVHMEAKKKQYRKRIKASSNVVKSHISLVPLY
jgi:hypothetical protein